MKQFGFRSTCIVVLLAVATSSQAKDEKKSPQVELVRKLYKSFAWETVLYPETGETLAEQPKGVLRDYFDDELAALLASDAECAKKRNICRLDVDPLFGMRDPIAHNLEVLPADTAGVVVRFLGVSGGSEAMTEIVIQMGRSGRGSRISDVVYPNGPSLKTRLTAPLE